MSHPACPRQIVFSLPGMPGVQITATEVGGTIQFTVDVTDSSHSSADLRALFFDINEAELAGLTVSSTSSYLTESRVGLNNILDLGQGANLNGIVKKGFDVGLEWGTPGGHKDDINFPVSFTISNTTGDLTLDDLGGMLFGAKLDSLGGLGGPSGSSSKLTVIAPYAPDAIDDAVNMFEDGASGLNDPSKTPAPVTIDVLANDTDADTAQGNFMVEHIVEGPLHGTVEISADGRYIYYTPDLDYSGADSFWYCMTDGAGGQDSAQVTINIAAVADDALITFEIDQGATINETLVTVTATQNDADGSEVVSSLDWTAAGLPAGATITPLGPIAGGGNSITQQFVVTTAMWSDWNFGIDFTAVTTEASNADTEASTQTQSIVGNSESLDTSLIYSVNDQSIWDTGAAFVYDLSGDDGFFGVDVGDSDAHTYEDPILGIDVAGYEYEYALRAGFQLDVHMEGGAIDASIPIDVTVDATYNHTTDNIYIEALTSLGSGGSFLTSGPEGSLSLDFIFNYLIDFYAWAIDSGLSIDFGPLSDNFNQNIIDLDTNDPAYVWPVLPGVVDVIAEWPHISVANDAGLMSGSDVSNYFLQAVLDVDGLANYLLGGTLSWIDSDPTTEDNFEVLDVDLAGGLRLLQEFAIGLSSGQSVNVVLEDGYTTGLTFGTGLWIADASSHDSDGNGTVDFSFALAPDVELSNSTSIDVGMEVQLAFIRNLDLFVTTFTAYDETYPLFDIPIEVYSNTFDLTGVGSQDVALFV